MDSVKIERISETKRGRYALHGGGEFLFSVDEETLVKHGIKEGSCLSGQELSLLRQASDTRKAKDQALRYLSLRAYGERELYDKLCLKYDEPTCAAVMAWLGTLALLDDEAFAQAKAQGLADRKKSRAEIRRKLLSLGLAQELVDRVIDDTPQDDVQTALTLLRRSYMEKLRRGEREKVLAALARRGFTYGDIREALSLALQEIEEEAES